MTGNNYWIFLGPAVIALCLIACVGLVVFAAGRPSSKGDPGEAHGPVAGGIFEGDPGQRNTTSEPPSG